MFLLAGCIPSEPVDEGPVSFQERFVFRLGEVSFRAQVALTDTERRQGLMHRRSLEADEGMLFVFPDRRERGFWMRNVSIPLDIGYFDGEGVLREIHPLYPHNEDSVRSHSSSIQFALEMNRDWFRDNGIRTGVRLDMDEVREAIRRRGYSPHDFAIRSTPE